MTRSSAKFAEIESMIVLSPQGRITGTLTKSLLTGDDPGFTFLPSVHPFTGRLEVFYPARKLQFETPSLRLV
jgi:hypothetical protein